MAEATLTSRSEFSGGGGIDRRSRLQESADGNYFATRNKVARDTPIAAGPGLIRRLDPNLWMEFLHPCVP